MLSVSWLPADLKVVTEDYTGHLNILISHYYGGSIIQQMTSGYRSLEELFAITFGRI